MKFSHFIQSVRFGTNGKHRRDIFASAAQQCGFGVIDVCHRKCKSTASEESFSVCSTAYVFTFLFNFQSEFDAVLFVIDIVVVICALTWCLLFCYFGDMASNRLSSIGYSAFSADWYNYPVKWQKFLVLMIKRSQRPANFKGLQLITCTLEVFGKVNHRQM